MRQNGRGSRQIDAYEVGGRRSYLTTGQQVGADDCCTTVGHLKETPWFVDRQ